MKPLRLRTVPIAVTLGAVVLLYLLFVPSSKKHHDRSAAEFDYAQANKDPNADKPYDDLVKWLKKSGAEFSAVSGHARALAGGGRGLFATKPFDRGQAIIKIPAECWISHRSILRSSPSAHVIREDAVLRQVIKEDATWAVIFGMEYERHNEYSQWKEYLHFMRRQESPIWWTHGELEDLQSATIRDHALKNQEDLDAMFHRVYPHLYRTYPEMWNAEENTKESFYWSALTMWGRAFNVAAWNSTVGTEYGIVPIADLLNHDGGRPSTWEMEYHDSERPGDPTAFVFHANRKSQPGDEVMISYGDTRASFNFFLFCGFIPRGQIYGDYIALVMVQNGHNMLECAVGNDGRITNNFLDHLNQFMKNSKQQALEMLKTAVDRHLSAYPTTFEDDSRELNSGDNQYKRWATLTYRVRMKGIYVKLAENIESMLRQDFNPINQKHPADVRSIAKQFNQRRPPRNTEEAALDILRIEI